MAEELGEKTEEPTAHRMNKARDEGQVAWSKDFASFVVLFSGTVALMLLAIFGTGLLKDWLAFGLNRATGGFDDGLRSFRDAGLGFALVVFPVAGLVTLLAAAGGFLQVGFRPTTKTIGFKPEKLNPVKGLQRILGPEGFVRGALDSGKVMLLLWWQDALGLAAGCDSFGFATRNQAGHGLGLPAFDGNRGGHAAHVGVVGRH